MVPLPLFPNSSPGSCALVVALIALAITLWPHLKSNAGSLIRETALWTTLALVVMWLLNQPGLSEIPNRNAADAAYYAQPAALNASYAPSLFAPKHPQAAWQNVERRYEGPYYEAQTGFVP